MFPFTDREGITVAMGLGVRVRSSRSGGVCLAVSFWNLPKLSANKFYPDQ